MELEHTESNTRIYFTTDYGRFKFLKGNRDINEAKVKKIKQDIESGIDFLKYAPIIVNDKMEIIDGQHRYAVSMALKTNVYYVINQTADLEVVPAINSKSTKWRTVDFLNSYVDLKRPVYCALNDFVKIYKGIGIPTAAKMFHTGTVNEHGAMEAFQEGRLTAEHMEYAHDIATLLSDFQPYTVNAFSRGMFAAMITLNGNGKYNHEFMLKKLQESGRRIENLESTKSIIQDMESIINHKSKHRIIIH